MKEILRAIVVLTLVAFVVIGVSGCHKKTPNNTGNIVETEPVNPDFPWVKDVNTEVYGNPVYFDFDKSDIKDESKPILEAIAMDLKANTKKYLRVEGNCDERGTNEYNLGLGERRALSTREYLIILGVNKERIATITYGEEQPADPGHDEAAWAKNRRSDFSTYVKPEK